MCPTCCILGMCYSLIPETAVSLGDMTAPSQTRMHPWDVLQLCLRHCCVIPWDVLQPHSRHSCIPGEPLAQHGHPLSLRGEHVQKVSSLHIWFTSPWKKKWNILF